MMINKYNNVKQNEEIYLNVFVTSYSTNIT